MDIAIMMGSGYQIKNFFSPGIALSPFVEMKPNNPNTLILKEIESESKDNFLRGNKRFSAGMNSKLSLDFLWAKLPGADAGTTWLGKNT